MKKSKLKQIIRDVMNETKVVTEKDNVFPTKQMLTNLKGMENMLKDIKDERRGASPSLGAVLDQYIDTLERNIAKLRKVLNKQ